MSGKIALVTGAASGIGLATAQSLVAAGHGVQLVDIDDKVEAVAREAAQGKPDVRGWRADLRDPSAIANLVRDIERSVGGVDILVNNAGIHLRKPDGIKFPIEELSVEAWNAHLAINLTAPFLLCQAVLPQMKKKRWGRIINVGSMVGRAFGLRPGAGYAASKAGLLGLTRVVAGEAGPHGITANYVAPGRIRTPLSDAGGAASNSQSISHTPVGRLGEPWEIAAAIQFLTSDQAAFITGATFDVNGGQYIP
jgi:3-oxoacyl-[acyl-carrier protein] reductase